MEGWFPALSVGRLLKWAFFLWAVNLVFLGPIAVAAASAGGATHRLNVNNIPWMAALVWAPIVEELVFRYGLRRIGSIWWLTPAAVAAMLMGAQWSGILLLGGILLVCWLPYLSGMPYARKPIPWRYRLVYRSEEHTSELQSLMRLSYAVFSLKKKKNQTIAKYKD